MYQLADILLTRGNGPASRWIADLSKEDGSKEFSHAALVIAGDPLPLLVEAISPRVHICTVDEALERAAYAVLVSPLNISDEDRLAISKAGLAFENQLYGYFRYIGFLGDTVLQADWCSLRLGIPKSHPVCSVLVAASYGIRGLDFAEPARGVTPNEIGAFAYRHEGKKYSLSQVK